MCGGCTRFFISVETMPCARTVCGGREARGRPPRERERKEIKLWRKVVNKGKDGGGKGNLPMTAIVQVVLYF